VRIYRDATWSLRSEVRAHRNGTWSRRDRVRVHPDRTAARLLKVRAHLASSGSHLDENIRLFEKRHQDAFSFRESIALDPVKGARPTNGGAWCAPLVVSGLSERKEMIMANVNRTNTQAHDAQVIAGIGKHLQTVSSLPLLGSTYTPAALVKLVQSRIDSANGSIATKATWHSTVVEDKALNAKLTPVIRALRQYVINVFGEASPVLADFGFTASKRATRTPEEKAAAAAKAKATRAARHTMGKKQKKDVKGTVPTTAPATSPSPAAPPTATSVSTTK
jgi:hypothetical protein